MLSDYTAVTPETVAEAADAALAAADALVAETLAPLELAGAEIAVGFGRSAFMAGVHPQAAVIPAPAGHAARLTMLAATGSVLTTAGIGERAARRRFGGASAAFRHMEWPVDRPVGLFRARHMPPRS